MSEDESRAGSLAAACRKQLIESLRICTESVHHTKCCLILSGGVDTTAILCAAEEAGVTISGAFTVIACSTATDRLYAVEAASRASLAHHVIDVTLHDLLAERLPLCVRSLRTFDGMELRNSLVVAEALTKAQEHGFDLCIVGDAADELLGGYSFSWRSNEPVWSQKRSQMCSQWTFCASTIAAALTRADPEKPISVCSPYMEKGFAEWALNCTTKDDCVGEREVAAFIDTQPELHVTGKIPLREAFPESSSAWRRKDPIEVGSGSTELSKPEFWTDLIPTAELEAEKQRIEDEEGIQIRDSEHLFYYREFVKQFLGGVIDGIDRHGSDPCIACGYQLRHPQGLFCHVCGMYPARATA